MDFSRAAPWTIPPFYGSLTLAFVALVLPFGSLNWAAGMDFAAFFLRVEGVLPLGETASRSFGNAPGEAKQFQDRRLRLGRSRACEVEQ